MVGGRSGGWRNLETRSPTGPRFRACCLLSYSFNVPKTRKKKELATPMSSAPITCLVVTLDSTLVDQLFGTLVGMFYTLISMMIGTYQYIALMLIGT